MKLDKKYLLLYTDIGQDKMRHSFHAWFLSEEELRGFVNEKMKTESFQSDFAIEITNYRWIKL